MTNYMMYWNNICILSKQEEQYLEGKIKLLKENYNINLDIKYFGLGKEEKLSKRLKSDLEENKIPDIIVSTDLDAFENNDLYSQYRDKLQDGKGQFAFKDIVEHSNVSRNDKLVPFLSIPLLLVVNKEMIKGEVPRTLEELLESCEHNTVVFGGVNNSAGTSVVKGIWYKFGEYGLNKVIENSVIREMPIQAFNDVKMGKYAIGIVPSIFAGIGKSQENIEVIWPKDGAIAIPSYIAINKEVGLEPISIIKNEIFTKDFCEFFVNRGDIICFFSGIGDTEDSVKNNFNLIYPSDSWLNNLKNEEFLNIYEKIKRV